jgi:hypothetical protein
MSPGSDPSFNKETILHVPRMIGVPAAWSTIALDHLANVLGVLM